MRVEEYTEPPEPPGASMAAVDAGIDADAAEFAQGGLDAAGAGGMGGVTGGGVTGGAPRPRPSGVVGGARSAGLKMRMPKGR